MIEVGARNAAIASERPCVTNDQRTTVSGQP